MYNLLKDNQDKKYGYNILTTSDLFLSLIGREEFQYVASFIIKDIIEEVKKENKTFENLDELIKYITENYI